MIKAIKNLIALGILSAALIQWYGIGERTYHAWWMWYKFKDYGGGGRTDLSIEMTIITYVVSAILIISAFFMQRQGKLDKLFTGITKVALIMLVIGVACLSILLVSPYAVLVKR